MPRVLPEGLAAEIDTSTWEQGPIFDYLQEHGAIRTDEMRRTFNCGVGMIVVVSADAVDETVRILNDAGERAWRIGQPPTTATIVRAHLTPALAADARHLLA